MTKAEKKQKEYVELFKQKFGDKEVKLNVPVLTIFDEYASPFSSGTSGHITKVRVKGEVLEFYHSWWRYGWFPYLEIHKQYPRAVTTAIKRVLK